MVTGIPMTAKELEEVGERVWNLKKAFNIREGWTKADDWLPAARDRGSHSYRTWSRASLSSPKSCA